MDMIQGSVNRIISHKTGFSAAGNKFLIARFIRDDQDAECTVKGEMNSPILSWRYRLYGEWKTDTYGDAFNFHAFEPVIANSHEGMADYLARQVPAIGKVRARLIVDHFGDDSFSILRIDPSRLREIPGIPQSARDAAIDYFESAEQELDPAAYARLFDLLSPIHPPQKVIISLLKSFKSNAPQFVVENPYRLLDYPGMGWDRVDRFAVQVLKYNPGGIERHACAVAEVLARHSEYGHTKVDHPTVYVDTSNLLKMALRQDALDHLSNVHLIVIDENNFISLKKLYDAELTISEELKRLSRDPQKLSFALNDHGLEDEQRQVPELIRNCPVCILTGVPGSGKTLTISRMIKQLYENGIEDILVVAPTGKAAKRNSEFLEESIPGISIPCMTIHRALGGRIFAKEEEGIPQEEARINRGRNRFHFEHGSDNMLPYEFFIVDESSMVDVELAAAFLKAIPDGSRLLIVGDHHQLPSVGPGSVLRDMLAAGISSVVFDKPRRNSGIIALSCYLIKEGKRLHPEYLKQTAGGESNWVHVEQRDDARIAKLICDTHINYVAKYGRDAAKADLQVISPEKKGILGCINLNELLSAILNPASPDDKSTQGAIRLYDKVVRTKNGTVKQLVSTTESIGEDEDPMITTFDGSQYYVMKTYVVNGDMGEVVGFKNTNIMVRFLNPDRLCMLPKGDAHILLAYALTVHKMQGSSAPVCVLPLSNYYWNSKTNTGLFCRELLYTSFSRPSSRLITIGRLEEANAAISRVTIHGRQTRLLEFLSHAS
jgi:exodeoxyribonuclease V alpha subunit